MHEKKFVQLVGLILNFDVENVSLEPGLAENEDSNPTVHTTEVTDLLPVDTPRIARSSVNRP